MYRATVDVAKMRAVPELSWILEKPGLNLWYGDAPVYYLLGQSDPSDTAGSEKTGTP